MPIKIPAKLPAADTLTQENIFVMTEERASMQDIRPLRIAILNLMPTKIITETQILRLLGNSPLQIEIELIQTKTHKSKNTSEEHLTAFYKTFDDIRHEKFDGMIITGAPVELLPFEEVDYWEELVEIMEWTKTHVMSTFHICWGAQAGLYYHYGVPKYDLPRKMFGVYSHVVTNPTHPLTRGFSDLFDVPQSRHTEVRAEDVAKIPELEILSYSEIAGLYLIASRDGRQIFVTGHSEYDANTLHDEYQRDLGKGLPIRPPYRYYPHDDPTLPPVVHWRGHANLLYINWLNYFVYQITPYDLNELETLHARKEEQ